jgi:hypothetical protein
MTIFATQRFTPKDSTIVSNGIKSFTIHDGGFSGNSILISIISVQTLLVLLFLYKIQYLFEEKIIIKKRDGANLSD